LPKAEQLYKSWSKLGVPVKIGGPARGERSGEFTPGLYLKQGYTITSRGCFNKCWFCNVWRREGELRELEIKDGHIITDDKILACSEPHFRAVIEMLKRQPERPLFVGGIEAALLKPWQAGLIREAKTKRLYCAYDTKDDYEPLVGAGRIFRDVGFTTTSHALRCYVLAGYDGDTFEKAERRLIDTMKAGFVPFAMLYRGNDGNCDPDWRVFQREWCRPAFTGAKMKIYGGKA
jgi:hypothetical protein